MSQDNIGLTADFLRLRVGPGLDFDIRRVLPPDTRLTILEDQGVWLKVMVDGQEGFVMSEFVRRGEPESHFLAHQPDLLSLPLEPAVTLATSAGGRAAELAADIWNRFGGFLSPLAERLGVDGGVAVAVLAAESGGRGMGPDGRMIIRFENHIFWQQWGKANEDAYNAHFRVTGPQVWQGHEFRPDPSADWLQVHIGRQSREWDAFTVAQNLDDNASKRSISMGLPQIMGFNHKRIGYASAAAMFDAFASGEQAQLAGFFDFIAADAVAVEAIRTQDFFTFAQRYNGIGQEELYAGRIQSLVDGFHQLEPMGGTRGPARRAPARRKPAKSPILV